MRFVILIALALATSLDSLGVGVAFGLNGTRIRPRAHAIISAVMLAITATSVWLGNHMADLLPDRVSHWLSCALFVGVGIGMLVPVMRAFRAGNDTFGTDSQDLPCPIQSAIAVRNVRLREAFGLGIMLSLNNIGGGVSAGLIHLDPMQMAAFSVIFNVLCLVIGHYMGCCLRRTPIRDWAQVLAGVTMVAIGIYQVC